MIPLSQIRLLNPRARSKAKFSEIVSNIAAVGLKKPITVAPREDDPGVFDLVCGQGRLEAYQTLGQTEVPALVRSVPKHDRYIMSLVENVAGCQPTSMALVRELGALRERGYSHAESATKVGISGGYVSMLLRLLDNGEERLIRAVERGEVPIAVAIEIASSDDVSIQQSLTPVADIMSLARSNRIAPSALAAMAERSVERLLALLPPPSSMGEALDLALTRELDASIALLSTANDPRKNTADALALLRASRKFLADGELRWSGWSKLSAVQPSKRSEVHVLGVRLAAGRYGEHPRLHQELRDATHAIFDAARAGLVAYQEWKRERRVVDYVDMIDGALDLVDHSRVRADLSRRLQLIVVDEFQDTSPIQLAFFVRLHALAGRSVWVGDRKQCIFEYAGADPVLMDAVTEWVGRNGGRPDRLGDNHRSRPELVRACSELFAAALARHGFAREEVVVAPVRPALEALEALPPFGFWALDVESVSDDAEAVGEGVRRLLETPHVTPI